MFLLLTLFSFLLGAIPFGLVISKIYGVEIRKQGSGNIGATNVYRTIGKFAGILTFLLDLLKGVISIEMSRYFLNYPLDFNESAAVIGLAAILGHCFSPFLAGNGGKGIATSFGVFMYLAPTVTGIVFLIFVTVFYFSRYVSLSSLISTFSLSVLLFSSYGLNPITFVGLFTTIVVFLRHRENIKRLLVGKENRFARAQSRT